MQLLLTLVLVTSPVFAQTPPTAGPPPVVLPPVNNGAPSQAPDGFGNGKTPFAGEPTNSPAAAPFGCAPGPTQAQCLQTVQRMMPGQQKKKDDGMEKAMQILNAVGSALGGGGGGYEPADGHERMAAGGSGADQGGGGYGSGASTTMAKDLKMQSGRGTARIVPVFQKYFDMCTQSAQLGTCRFRNDGIWGDAAHMARKSCHNDGRAIDVGLPFVCEQGTYKWDDPKMLEVAKCLDGNNELKVTFRNCDKVGMGQSGVSCHRDHMHVKLRECPW